MRCHFVVAAATVAPGAIDVHQPEQRAGSHRRGSSPRSFYRRNDDCPLGHSFEASSRSAAACCGSVVTKQPLKCRIGNE